MSGPDEELAALLDRGGPTADDVTLHHIVVRHRRRVERRLKRVTAASVVTAIAAVGVTIGFAEHTPKPAAVDRARAPRLVPRFGSAAPKIAGPKITVHASAPGTPPAGLTWVSSGAASGATAARRVAVPAAQLPAASTTTSPGTASGPIAALCTVDGCDGSASGPLTDLFVRAGGGVTIRAFTQPDLPIMFVPVGPVVRPEGSPSTTGSGASGSSDPGSTAATSDTSTSTTAAVSVPTSVVALPPASDVTSTGAASTTTEPTTTEPTTTEPTTTEPTTTEPVSPPVSTTVASSPTSAGSTSGDATCRATETLRVEVSDPGAVGVVTVPLGGAGGSAAIDLIEASVLGQPEGAPMIVVVAHVGASVAQVSATFADGTTDSMAPDGGWVVLADAVPSSQVGGLPATGESVSLVASDASSATLETTTVASEPALAVPTSCVTPSTTVPVPQTGTSASGASAGTPAGSGDGSGG